jgi:hypothetical protein
MLDSPLRSEPSLAEFLIGRARNASDGRLALDVGLGVVVTIVVLIWRPGGWHIIASAALCFLAFGAWGITDRELENVSAASLGGHRLLRVGRAVAVGVGALAAGTLLISLLAIALGTWIS